MFLPVRAKGRLALQPGLPLTAASTFLATFHRMASRIVLHARLDDMHRILGHVKRSRMPWLKVEGSLTQSGLRRNSDTASREIMASSVALELLD